MAKPTPGTNARLIAAAPDLLEALRDLVYLDELERKNGTTTYAKRSPSEKFWNAARKAIAKATP